jgi:hypothetical protein
VAVKKEVAPPAKVYAPSTAHEGGGGLGGGDGGGGDCGGGEGGGGEGEGGGGDGDGGGGDGERIRGLQSVQSVPRVQALHSDPGPPSSHSPSEVNIHISVQVCALVKPTIMARKMMRVSRGADPRARRPGEVTTQARRLIMAGQLYFRKSPLQKHAENFPKNQKHQTRVPHTTGTVSEKLLYSTYANIFQIFHSKSRFDIILGHGRQSR